MKKILTLFFIILLASGCGGGGGAGGSGSGLEIQAENLSDAVVYQDYSATLQASGGVPPYTWGLENSKSLTPGLSISHDGVISGRPYFNGTWNFQVQVTDAAGTAASKDLSIIIQGDLHILVSEVLYDTPGTDSLEEWIELYNPASFPMDLTGYSISDMDQAASIPRGTIIPANGTLVWARDRDGFFNLYGFYPDIDGFPLSLNNGGDLLTLKDPSDNTVDQVGFETTGWESLSGAGMSIERQSLYDTDSAADWRDSGNTGNPGEFPFAPTADRAPAADAGKDRIVEGSQVALDASGSSDPDGDDLSYTWDVGLTGAGPVFAPGQTGLFNIGLTVSDGVLEDFSSVLVYFLPPGEKITGTPYYNDPPDSRSIDGDLISLIDGAQVSVDTAIYELDLPGITNALINAKNRGVNVRVVTENDNYQNPGPFADLEAAGITVVRDDKPTYNHNKFFIIDGRFLWTGSYNATQNCTYNNGNSVISIDSPELSQKFTTEFEEMFTNRRFGTNKQNQSSGSLNINGHQVVWAFSPNGNTKQKLLDAIESANYNIYFCIFSFTDDDVRNALIAKHTGGVEVKGVFDEYQSGLAGAEYDNLAAAGIGVVKDPYNGLLHHKLMIIDAGTDSDPKVAIGSVNWSNQGFTANDENLLVIDDPYLADIYRYLFDLVY
ncbi:MAG: phospholipase D-like domain-containing protein [Chloroflexi bacterium]|nr:phospholipase D-like domain-containing protein [Chloroflexota bacterium]